MVVWDIKLLWTRELVSLCPQSVDWWLFCFWLSCSLVLPGMAVTRKSSQMDCWGAVRVNSVAQYTILNSLTWRELIIMYLYSITTTEWCSTSNLNSKVIPRLAKVSFSGLYYFIETWYWLKAIGLPCRMYNNFCTTISVYMYNNLVIRYLLHSHVHTV